MDGRWTWTERVVLLLLWPVMLWQAATWRKRAAVLAVIAAALLMAEAVFAAEPPRAALRYRGELTRAAHFTLGLDAPVPMFAGQLHAESSWNPSARSAVGAAGMAQFMPATSRWINSAYPALAATGGGLATNPSWAIRALVTYDTHLYALVPGGNQCDRWWAALRGYNGGLGHWLAEARIAGSYARAQVDAACGKARRSVRHCAENVGYPKRILLTLQPRYAAWGPIVDCGAAA